MRAWNARGMRKVVVSIVVAVLASFVAPVHAEATPLSSCALNSAIARAWFTEPPIEPELRTSEYTGEVAVYGSIFCRHVSVTATFEPHFSYGSIKYGVPGVCVPDSGAVGGTAGWCTMRTVHTYQEIGTIIGVAVTAAGVDDLGLPVTRTGRCWLMYYYGEGPYQSCSPW